MTTLISDSPASYVVRCDEVAGVGNKKPGRDLLLALRLVRPGLDADREAIKNIERARIVSGTLVMRRSRGVFSRPRSGLSPEARPR